MITMLDAKTRTMARMLRKRTTFNVMNS